MNSLDLLPPHLTTEQRRAVLHQGSPLLIIAGPGSGKTEVISWRVAHLVRSGQVSAKNLLVTTFTCADYFARPDRILRSGSPLVVMMQASQHWKSLEPRQRWNNRRQ